jgi:hypothetical protein
MDDKFLYELQEQPDAIFINSLQRKLSESYPQTERWMMISQRTQMTNRGWMLAVVFLVITLLVAIAISPVRALVSSIIINHAGLSYEVTDDYPGDNYPSEEIIEPRIMPLDKALAIYPHEIRLPTYVPSGYILNGRINVFVGDESGPFMNTIEFNWRSDGKMSYILRITDHNDRNREIIAPASSIEEIMLADDQSAVLIHGGWDFNTQAWSNTIEVYRLKWLVGNLTYDLMGMDRDQTIKIAQSMIK